jgi:S1-C subfamily serine protease
MNSKSVSPGSAAERAGVRGGTTDVVVAGESHVLGGDVVVAVGGTKVSSTDELRDVLADRKSGQRVNFQIHRGTKIVTLAVKLGRQPPAQG